MMQKSGPLETEFIPGKLANVQYPSIENEVLSLYSHQNPTDFRGFIKIK